MCARDFYAFLRIGEITVTKQSPGVLQLRQLEKLFNLHGDTEAIKATFYSFKHHYNEPPLSVVLTRQPVVCPVNTLLVYLQFRGCQPGPIFQHLDGSRLPVLNFVTGWQGRSRAVVLTQTVIRVIAFASGQLPSPPSVAIPKPRFVFWGDGNQMLLKCTFAYLVCKVHVLVSALLLRQLLVWNMAASRPRQISLQGWLFSLSG